MTASGYPGRPVERTRWILDRRGRRNAVFPGQPSAFFVEQERGAFGTSAATATVFLVNRECPWKCAMCDLWRDTTTQPVPPGEIPAQIRFALARLPGAEVLKLYNSGSFFDEGAIPAADWPAIAGLARPFSRLIVECHPRLAGPRVLAFQEMLTCRFEVALGLETAHPGALEAINKRITPADFSRAARFLARHGIAVRAFLLIRPPFVPEPDQTRWLRRSLELAFDSGAETASLIPLRAGNGAVEDLAALGLAREPRLTEIEEAQETGLAMGRGRVFADTWDLRRFSSCPQCLEPRARRIVRMNLSQQTEPRIPCPACARD